jgi:hypothetical protein
MQLDLTDEESGFDLVTARLEHDQTHPGRSGVAERHRRAG